MKKFKIYEIESVALCNEFIWSNFNIENTLQCRKYFRVDYKNAPLYEVRCTYINEYSMYIEIGIIRTKRLCSALNELLNYLKRSSNAPKMILTFVVSEDKLGIWMLKKVGFTVDVVWRELVEINGEKYNIEVLGVDCR